MSELNGKRIYAKISFTKALNNLNRITKDVPANVKRCLMIKADGYGFGAKALGIRFEKDFDFFGVASSEEAYELRNIGIKKPILLMGPVSSDDYEKLIKEDVRLTVFDLERAKLLSEISEKLGKNVKIHLAVDTGMSRIGVSPDSEGLKTVLEMSKLPGIEFEGIFTHLANGDSGIWSDTEKPYQLFSDFLNLLNKNGVEFPIRHISNTAATMLHQNLGFDMVRIGVSFYGIRPSDIPEFMEMGLEPIMELKSSISYVKTIKKGTGVSYGSTFVADHDMKVGTVPCGYADGIPRELSNKGYVLIQGQKAPILGRICMDQMMVSLENVPDAEIGEEVTIIGRDGNENITLEDIELMGGRFRYELPTLLTRRVEKIYG